MRTIDSPQPGPNRATGGDVSPDTGSRRGLEELLAEWIGLDPSTLGAASLSRACQRRLEATGAADFAALQALVENDPQQRDLLVEEVVVSESWFFRDEQTFAFLETFARTLAAMPGRQPLRILSIPCACGEEPYSIAMRLLDAGMPAASFTIDAYDVSHACLVRAQEGRYTANAFRNAEQGFRRRWFREEGSRAVIDPEIRKLVRFSWGNLLEQGFAAGQGTYDIIFCRNLLIYLTSEARRHAEATIDRLLATDGALVLGAAEPPIMSGRWAPAGATSMFALRRQPSGERAAAFGQLPNTPRRTGTPTRPRAASLAGTAPPSTAEHPRTATSTSDSTATTPLAAREAIAEERATLLTKAGELANAGRHIEAIAACEAYARDTGPSPDLFFMLGTFYQAHGDLDRAEGCFHKTLYLDPVHEEAALALALVAGSRGDERMADFYRDTAARIFARKGSR